MKIKSNKSPKIFKFRNSKSQNKFSCNTKIILNKSLLLTNKVQKKKSNIKESIESKLTETKTEIIKQDYLDHTQISSVYNNRNYNINTSRTNFQKEKSRDSNKILIINNSNNNINNNTIHIYNNNNSISYDIDNQKETAKIDYKYYTNFINIDNIINKRIHNVNIINKNNINYNNNYCWLATYDKLMKRKKLIKIINFYGKKINENTLIEKCLTINDFEIFFNHNSEKPYIRPMKNAYILVKLYLLSYEEINFIASYINRINQKININGDNYRNIEENKGKLKILFNDVKYYPYPLMYFLGNYMNINIYSFSNNFYSNKNNMMITDIKYPSSKKIAKLIKIFINNFNSLDKQKYNIDFFIFYLLENVKFINFNQKYLEIKKILGNENNKKSKFNIFKFNTYKALPAQKKNYNKDYYHTIDNINNDINSNIINNITLSGVSNNSKMINSKLDCILTDSSLLNNDMSSEGLSFNYIDNFYNFNNKSSRRQNYADLNVKRKIDEYKLIYPNQFDYSSDLLNIDNSNKSNFINNDLNNMYNNKKINNSNDNKFKIQLTKNYNNKNNFFYKGQTDVFNWVTNGIQNKNFYSLNKTKINSKKKSKSGLI